MSSQPANFRSPRPAPRHVPAPNPFATRWVAPGALPYVFPEGTTADQLVERLQAAGWQGEITGPHGSGKSTLLAALRPAIDAAGRMVVLIELHDGQRRLGTDLKSLPGADGRRVLFIDGYEQLGTLPRWRLRAACRRRGDGLLVTAHAPTGLPTIWRTGTTLPLARELVARLLADSPLDVPEQALTEGFERHEGNLRELLFDLYDWHEAAARGGEGERGRTGDRE